MFSFECAKAMKWTVSVEMGSMLINKRLRAVKSREAGDKLKREKYRFCGAERGVRTPRGIFLTAAKADDVSGDDSKEDPPVPIPNTEVKLFRVDDTWRATAWESRTLPE